MMNADVMGAFRAFSRMRVRRRPRLQWMNTDATDGDAMDADAMVADAMDADAIIVEETRTKMNEVDRKFDGWGCRRDGCVLSIFGDARTKTTATSMDECRCDGRIPSIVDDSRENEER